MPGFEEFPVQFTEFPKIARLSREIVITEKLDGTNAQVCVSDDGVEVRAGSRNCFLTPEADNFGFARWVKAHEAELITLGPGIHYGEWWGQGIQRGYGLTEKRFSLFNVGRWHDQHWTNAPGEKTVAVPICCHVVPILWAGQFKTEMIERVITGLATTGSMASPHFMSPEGIVIFHAASGQMFKKTIKDDEKPKGSKEVG